MEETWLHLNMDELKPVQREAEDAGREGEIGGVEEVRGFGL